MKMVRLVGLAGSLIGLAGAMQAQSLLTNPSNTSLSAKVTIAHVDETPHERHMRRLWIASIAAMTAGTAADAMSSWHKRESNGLLASSDGTFGAKGLTIKGRDRFCGLVPQIVFRSTAIGTSRSRPAISSRRVFSLERRLTNLTVNSL